LSPGTTSTRTESGRDALVPGQRLPQGGARRAEGEAPPLLRPLEDGVLNEGSTSPGTAGGSNSNGGDGGSIPGSDDGTGEGRDQGRRAFASSGIEAATTAARSRSTSRSTLSSRSSRSSRRRRRRHTGPLDLISTLTSRLPAAPPLPSSSFLASLRRGRRWGCWSFPLRMKQSFRSCKRAT